MFAALIAILVVTVWTLLVVGEGGPATVLANRPECPHDWTDVHNESTYAQPVVDLDPLDNGRFSISQEYTNVPEYHDCQRLIKRTRGPRQYGELAAVFISANVIRGTVPLPAVNLTSTTVQPIQVENGKNTLNVFDQSLILKQDSADTTQAAPVNDLKDLGIPWVQVVTEGDYPPLRLLAGFNCMYLKFNPEGGEQPPEATMVAFGLEEENCNNPNLAAAIHALPLRVKPSGTDRSSSNAIPMVARWDWDESLGVHLIGIPCGIGAWCDVGPYSEFNGSSPPGTVAAGDPPQKTIKGWYDEQYLASYSEEGVTPSSITGTVFPAAGLGSRDLNFYLGTGDSPFKEVARVAVTARDDAKYFGRYLFDTADRMGAFTTMTSIALCYGEADACKIPPDTGELALRESCKPTPQKAGIGALQHPMWARTTSADSTSHRYFCVAYRGHRENVIIPSVTRWRWRANDETIWIPCPHGCCEVDS